MEPLTPPESDLQDFAFMPLHVARLRDSDLAAEGKAEGCWYAVLLWAASWHQLPAGSLPDNEAVLARLCGLGKDTRTFRRHRADALRGWTVCTDGRLYHPVVAEQVNSSWAEKLAYRERKEKRVETARKAAAARWGEQEEPRSTPDADAQCMHEASPPDASCMPEAMPKGTGRGRGIDSEANASAAAAPPPVDDLSKSLFDRGVTLLTGKGRSESAARGVLAKFQKDFGNPAVLDAIERCRGATDPVSAMRAHLGRAKAQAEYLGV